MPDKPLAELLTLPAGRQLDYEIAKLRYPERNVAWYENRWAGLGYYADNGGQPGSGNVEKVSTDIAAAEPLLDAMLTAGVTVSSMAMWDNQLEMCFYFTETQREPTTIIVPTLAEKSLAFCQAWLVWTYGKEQTP
jgi:hypothetical protein